MAPPKAIAVSVGTTLKVVKATWGDCFPFLMRRDTLCGKIREKDAGEGCKLTSIVLSPSSMRFECYTTRFGKTTRVRWRFFSTLAGITRARGREGRNFILSKCLVSKESETYTPLKCGPSPSTRWRFPVRSSCEAKARFSMARRSRPRVDARGVGGARGFAGLRNVCF